MEGYGSPEKISPDPDGAPRPVAVPLPDAVSGRQTDVGLAARNVRLLPLSGKSDASLRKLAGRYLAWLDEREAALASGGEASGALLSDMAWTAGTGRSHFDHRAAVVFEDCKSLREGLRALAEADRRPAPRTSTKVAFAYTGHENEWSRMGEALYASEPVVRALLDRCDEVLGEAGGTSLLDVMFGRSGSAGNLDDPQWRRPAIYALQCALTALWSSVGVRPSLALGHGPGALAAAQAAGVLRLEDGLRLAAALDDPRSVLDDIEMSSPSLTLVNGVSGRVVGPDEVLGTEYWRHHAKSGPEAIGGGVGTLAEAGVDVIVVVGPDTPLVTMLKAELPEATGNTAAPVVLSSVGGSPDRGAAPTADSCGGFLESVAGAYEAGLSVSFPGLFAGESRRRVSLPDYPFERRRYWIKTREGQTDSTHG